MTASHGTTPAASRRDASPPYLERGSRNYWRASVTLTLLQPVAAIAFGIACVTFGFFAGHSTASGWVGRLATQGKGQAAALYLLSYYLGSSIAGSLGGRFWSAYGWPGVAALVATLLAVGLAAATWLRARERRGAA